MTKHFVLITFVLLVSACATYKPKYKDGKGVDLNSEKEVAHTFYLIGDAGLSPMNDMNKALKIFKKRLDRADKNSTAIFLGDNIYPAGLPDPKDSTAAYLKAKNDLDAQLKTLENFKGRPLFIPGNHDWYTEGLVGLKREQKYIQKALGSKEVYFPEDGCPIKTIEVKEDVAIIAIDTEWYLTNWDKRPDINDKCEIKSRARFWLELEDAIKDNRQKTTIIAMHHPVYSHGAHGGEFDLRRHFYPKPHVGPLPVIGSVINLLRKTTGASIEDLSNKRYRELRKRIVTLAQYSQKVILTSGHEHTLQYIVQDNTPQIVSGSGAKKGATRLINGSKFSTGQRGYAVLEVYKDGSSQVDFYGTQGEEGEQFLFTSQVLPPDRKVLENSYPDSFPATVKASVYDTPEKEKSTFFKFLWGNRYRKYYTTKVTAPTVNLDTLMGGLEPVHRGGGHQSKSLRLRHKSGREYVMRALKKDAELYLQAMAFQDQYVMGQFEDTYTEDFLLDFYTGSHPYAPFTTAVLSDAVGIYHTNPVLYYIPKQPALKDFNENYGDELYMIEEHAGDGHGDLYSYGYANELKSTDSMLEDLRDDEKYAIDSELYLRARLFDMVIGDWDRHVDQWRWAEFKDKDSGKVIYRPVPRDRDMVYSKHGDGFFMNLATRIVPALRLMEGFNEEIRSVKGFNASPKTYVLDVAVLPETTLEQWRQQALFLQENLTDEVIEKAFLSFPEEVRDDTMDEIKRILKSRLSKITETAEEYYRILNTYAVVVGTDKDDWFEVNILNKQQTEVKGYRNIKGEKDKLFFHKVFDAQISKEIWVYGLDDDDRFEVHGDSGSGIKVRLIGGHNNDIYDLEQGGNIVIYDYKSKKNSLKDTQNAKVKLTDDYNVNTYLPMQVRSSLNQLVPTIGFNPDDGLKIGLSDTYTYKGFRQNPFTQRHKVDASFYFATSGFELGYSGEFAEIFENWNFDLSARFTSPNFSVNFFGFGNESVNEDDDLGMDYNRVRIQNLEVSPSLVWRGQLGGKFKTGVSYESIQVEETDNRFINTFYLENGEENKMSFMGADAEYSFSNSDNAAFPTMGMSTSLKVGYKNNLTENKDFGYIVPTFSIDHRLIPNGRLVLATKWKAHFNIGDGYEFFQAASIGGIDGLRGFRNQRFTGKKSFYQNTDLRYSLRRMKTELLPVTMGLYGGFDYGRVWLPNLDSNVWHTSYGGGFFINGADMISARLALFNSEDGLRFSFGVGFGF
ncbi:metallophosphoesterase [Cytophaga sp. FL35]|uniref:metallophosphoesterase n=1 Tax=Cytophaga sp. FL35 TaxID=1904456 RepID=UPI001653A162|nr:metallophosphoesterase [Cytophaga sp. FL35]MBC6999036.1 metallophosphoesterase [Cytophaga sp. FL35]